MTGSQAAESRVPWMTSRLEGSPERPRPFVSQRVLPNLKFSEALDLAAVPGTNRLLVVERRGRIATFSVDDPAGKLEEVIHLGERQRVENAYGVALHPRFRDTRQIFVCYTLRAGQPDGTRVSRFSHTQVLLLATLRHTLTSPSGGKGVGKPSRT